MVSRYTKGSSTSLMIKEVKVKTTLRNHITPIRMPISERKTAESYESWRNQEETRTHLSFLSCCWDKIPYQNNLREKWFIWLLIQGQSLSWQRNHGGMWLEPSNTQSRAKNNECMHASAQLPFSILTQPRSLGNGAIHSRQVFIL